MLNRTWFVQLASVLHRKSYNEDPLAFEVVLIRQHLFPWNAMLRSYKLDPGGLGPFVKVLGSIRRKATDLTYYSP